MHLDDVRARFAALASDTVFLDNAGGSQVPDTVVDRVRRYLTESYVQLGADYELSRRASRTVAEARAFVRDLMGAREGGGEVVFGASTSALATMLADCYARGRNERDEIVVCEADHEANIAPWLALEARGYTIRWWRADAATGECSLAALRGMLSERTRLVAVRHVSNLLGAIEDIEGVVAAAHAVGARVFVDGVAFAPHRAIDVAATGVDWYAFSTYKVYGPHMAALFGRAGAFAELEGPGFYFVPNEAPGKFELGGANHEGCAAMLGVRDYLGALAGVAPGGSVDRPAIERAFARVVELERPLQERLLGWLGARDDVRLIGPRDSGPERVATISFTCGRPSREVALAANERGLAIRYGHFYSRRLAERLGLDPADGVVRASLVHYNSQDEVQRLIAFLGEAL